MHVTARQLRFCEKEKLWIVYLAGEGFKDFERKFVSRDEAISWANAFIALTNLKSETNE